MNWVMLLEETIWRFLLSVCIAAEVRRVFVVGWMNATFTFACKLHLVSWVGEALAGLYFFIFFFIILFFHSAFFWYNAMGCRGIKFKNNRNLGDLYCSFFPTAVVKNCLYCKEHITCDLHYLFITGKNLHRVLKLIAAQGVVNTVCAGLTLLVSILFVFLRMLYVLLGQV